MTLKNLRMQDGQTNPYLGDLSDWATAPKYGGETGLEPIHTPLKAVPEGAEGGGSTEEEA
eukprot:gene23245-29448_t